MYDSKIESNYLELFGRTDKNNFVYLRANYQNMKDSVYISNRFIMIIGMFAVIIGAVAMFYIGRSFTNPVRKLAEVADKMANLEFDVECDVNRDDEIGQLGKSMNAMSNKLQETITELKIANNELQKDIEEKEQIDTAGGFLFHTQYHSQPQDHQTAAADTQSGEESKESTGT